MSQKSRRKFIYDYPRPALTVDIAVVTQELRPRVLLIQRQNEPFAEHWALPGGFVDEGETLEQAALRELQEETSLVVPKLKQLHATANPGRDPRGWTATVLYLARVNPKAAKAIAGDDAAEVNWFPLGRLPPLAFDHSELLKHVRKAIKQPPLTL